MSGEKLLSEVLHMQKFFRAMSVLAIAVLVVPAGGCITGAQTTGSAPVIAVNRAECDPHTVPNAVWKRCMEAQREALAQQCRDQEHLERQVKTGGGLLVAGASLLGAMFGCDWCVTGVVAPIFMGGYSRSSERATRCPAPKGQYENVMRAGGGYWDY
jgi:hypothetical protein